MKIKDYFSVQIIKFLMRWLINNTRTLNQSNTTDQTTITTDNLTIVADLEASYRYPYKLTITLTCDNGQKRTFTIRDNAWLFFDYASRIYEKNNARVKKNTEESEKLCKLIQACLENKDVFPKRFNEFGRLLEQEITNSVNFTDTSDEIKTDNVKIVISEKKIYIYPRTQEKGICSSNYPEPELFYDLLLNFIKDGWSKHQKIVDGTRLRSQFIVEILTEIRKYNSRF